MNHTQDVRRLTAQAVAGLRTNYKLRRADVSAEEWDRLEAGNRVGVVIVAERGAEFRRALDTDHSLVATMGPERVPAELERTSPEPETSWVTTYESKADPTGESLAFGRLDAVELAAVAALASVELVLWATQRQPWGIEVGDLDQFWHRMRDDPKINRLVQQTSTEANGASFVARFEGLGMQLVRSALTGPELARVLVIKGWTRVFWDRQVTVQQPRSKRIPGN